ncbi:MAG: aldo/keto reductase [Chitinophagaceae bacterium]
MPSAFKQVSKIGLGCVTFGREIDQTAAFAMMDYAFDRGITFFDTASAYGAGASETIIGNWLNANRMKAEAIMVGTKIVPPYTPESIIASVSRSLARLQMEKIDLLYFHSWHPAASTVEALKVMNDLVESGKVHLLGASNFTAEQLVNAVRVQKDNNFAPFSFIQNNHNLAVSELSEELRHVCVKNEIRIVSYSPLAAGFLTGKHQLEVQPGSRFDLIPDHQNVYFHEHAYRRLVHLQSLASRNRLSPAHLALAWALHQPDVSSVLIGGRTPAHIDQAFAAIDFYDAELFDELECN